MNWITALRTRLIFHLQQRGGVGISSSVAADLGADRARRCRVYRGHRALECAFYRWDSVRGKGVLVLWRLNGHGLSAVRYFPTHAVRGTPAKAPSSLGWVHTHGAPVLGSFLHGDQVGGGIPTRSQGHTVRWRRNRIGPWPMDRLASGKGRGLPVSRWGGCACCGFNTPMAAVLFSLEEVIGRLPADSGARSCSPLRHPRRNLRSCFGMPSVFKCPIYSGTSAGAWHLQPCWGSLAGFLFRGV